MKRIPVAVAVVSFFFLALVPSALAQSEAQLQKLQAISAKVQACGSNTTCLNNAMKELQDVQKEIANSPAGQDQFGANSILRDIALGASGEPGAILQSQCNEYDKQNPKMTCLPVRVSVTDEVLEQAMDRTPSGMLPHPGTKYTTYYKTFSHTAEAKGKLLYEKDFASFYLIASATPKTTNIQGLVWWEQYYDYEGPNATPIRRRQDHRTSPSTIHRPFQLSILYPFEADNPATQASHNMHIDGTHVLFPAPDSADVYGTSLPDEHANEPMITPAVMKTFVKADGFQRTYSWTLKDGDGELTERHRLTINVKIGDICRDNNDIKIAIRTIDGMEKYKFSDAKPGKLTVTLQADVTPASYADKVEWDLPEIAGSQRQITPAEARGPQVTIEYTSLPKSNDSFGEKVVKAKVDVDSCSAEAQKQLRFYYPRDAKNNPEGLAPNWFYYWAQTPAAKPHGKTMDVEYAGGNFSNCRQKDVPAIFNPSFGENTLYVCDLSKLGENFTLVYPLLDRTQPNPYFGMRRSEGIDTFALGVIHEYRHYLAHHQWREGKSKAQIQAGDRDDDGVPDALEPAMLFDPTKFQTYMPDPRLDKVGGDEEWLAYEDMRDYAIGAFDKQDWGCPGKQW